MLINSYVVFIKETKQRVKNIKMTRPFLALNTTLTAENHLLI